MPEIASITPSLDGQVWLKCIAFPMLNRPVEVVGYSEVTRATGTSLLKVAGRSTPVAITDVRAAPSFELELLTRTAAAERDLDLCMTVGDTYFVHVPAGSRVPGGYVSIGDTSIERRSQRTERRRFTLPCTVTAAPGPGIVGTTLTWGTVLNRYGSWEALLAANPSWADLLALVGDPDDLVVI